MKQRWLHILLAILVLAQPVASAGAWASMLASNLAVSNDAPMELPGCHDVQPVVSAANSPTVDTPGDSIPDCCNGVNGVACGMDCGAASSAISQSAEPPAICGHLAYTVEGVYAAPSHAPASLFKPPRTS